MLYGNKMFEIVLNEYAGSNPNLKAITNLIQQYESKIRNKTQLQDVGKTKQYIEALNDSLSYIEYADSICSWTDQIMMIVKFKKDLIQKRYELELLKTQKQIELLQEIQECTSKTEKEKLRTKILKDQTIKTEHELDDVKNHLEFCKIFIEDARRTREYVYAYYQAIKRMGEGM